MAGRSPSQDLRYGRIRCPNCQPPQPKHSRQPFAGMARLDQSQLCRLSRHSSGVRELRRRQPKTAANAVVEQRLTPDPSKSSPKKLTLTTSQRLKRRGLQRCQARHPSKKPPEKPHLWAWQSVMRIAEKSSRKASPLLKQSQYINDFNDL